MYTHTHTHTHKLWIKIHPITALIISSQTLNLFKFHDFNKCPFIAYIYVNVIPHVQKIDTNRLPKQALQYKPKGRRNVGRPRKRWRDQLHLEDQGRGNMPNPSET